MAFEIRKFIELSNPLNFETFQTIGKNKLVKDKARVENGGVKIFTFYEKEDSLNLHNALFILYTFLISNATR